MNTCGCLFTHWWAPGSGAYEVVLFLKTFDLSLVLGIRPLQWVRAQQGQKQAHGVPGVPGQSSMWAQRAQAGHAPPRPPCLLGPERGEQSPGHSPCRAGQPLPVSQSGGWPGSMERGSLSVPSGFLPRPPGGWLSSCGPTSDRWYQQSDVPPVPTLGDGGRPGGGQAGWGPQPGELDSPLAHQQGVAETGGGCAVPPWKQPFSAPGRWCLGAA